jgi:hypothetical protein
MENYKIFQIIQINLFQKTVFEDLTIVVNTVPPLVILSDVFDYDYCARHGTCFLLCFH